MSYYDDKTESPTKKKIKKAKKSGMNIYSKKLNSLILLTIFLIICYLCKDIFLFHLINIFRVNLFFDHSFIEYNYQEIIFFFVSSIKEVLIILFPIFFFSILSIFFSPTTSKNFSYNINNIFFDISRLNIFIGIKKIFSYSIFLRFFKILIGILILFFCLIFYLLKIFSKTFSLIYQDYSLSFSEGMKEIFQLYFIFLISLLPVVIFDIFWKNYLYYKKLRMSYQELKDEFKYTEGNPQIKIKIREKMRNLIQEKFFLGIKKADIIITQSKKYIIVLKYDSKKMTAPKILIKGSKNLFSKIIKLGKKYNILCLNSPMLAKILYKKGKVGKYIPNNLYSSVADVFAWLIKFKKWKKEGGTCPIFQENLSKLLSYKYYRKR
jgi:flagellar biosynthetic protein FlhB